MRIKKADLAVSEMDMTPMIDMTFQLISFFMFVINFNNELVNEKVRLPIAEVARPVTQAQVDPLFLNVGSDGTLYIPGQPLQIRDPRQMAEIRSYLIKEATLIKVRMQALGISQAQGLDATVVIRADEGTEYGMIQDLIRSCRESGFTKFSLRANLKPGGGS